MRSEDSLKSAAVKELKFTSQASKFTPVDIVRLKTRNVLLCLRNMKSATPALVVESRVFANFILIRNGQIFGA
jgi:hypothetical protein